MNKHAHGTDEAIVAALKDLYRSEIQRAESDWIAVAASTVSLRHSRVGRASRGFALTTLIATLAMVAVLLSRQPGMFPGLGPSQSGGSQPTGSPGPGSPGGGSPKATAGTSVTPRSGRWSTVFQRPSTGSRYCGHRRQSRVASAFRRAHSPSWWGAGSTATPTRRSSVRSTWQARRGGSATCFGSTTSSRNHRLAVPTRWS